jgi:hypothetical protein
MSSKPVEPQLGAASFSCPHCGAFAKQYFLKAFAKEYGKGNGPTVLRYDDRMRDDAQFEDDEGGKKQRLMEFIDRFEKHTVTYKQGYGETCYWEMANLAFSMCFSCDGFAIWVEDKLIYPIRNATITAHAEMPAAIRADFDEAASIVDKSPRGAAALLRLCIQKLMGVLGEKGKDLNEDIGSLVRKGLPIRVKQALDIVRVTGNNAVHPGEINLKDDKATATTLFTLVNLIVENQIAQPSQIAAMFENLPSGALEQIERRDAQPQTDAKDQDSD